MLSVIIKSQHSPLECFAIPILLCENNDCHIIHTFKTNSESDTRDLWIRYDCLKPSKQLPDVLAVSSACLICCSFVLLVAECRL